MKCRLCEIELDRDIIGRIDWVEVFESLIQYALCLNCSARYPDNDQTEITIICRIMDAGNLKRGTPERTG